jgi:anthranilate synthase/aminodeoxychorismate synthase-like glutamine amidotransferase
MILLIDNYDSFVHNLARYFDRLGQSTRVVRNDAVQIDAIRAERPAAIVLSPGPCTPVQAGCSLQVVRELWKEIPMLGVCLGHQVIAEAFGGRIVRAPQPMHGRTSSVQHLERDVFAGVPNPVTVCRYHSLVAEEASWPSSLAITARTLDGIIMGLQHREAPVFGLQFHPEAILTDNGYRMLANFLRLAGLKVPTQLPSRTEELVEPAASEQPLPTAPVTF